MNRWSIINKIFFDNFIAAVIVEATFVLSNFVDGLVIGRMMPQTSMAAFGIAFPIFSAVGVFMGLFAIGTASSCSQELGKGNVKEFNRIFSSVLYIAGIVSVCLMILTIVFADPLVVLLGANGNGAGLKDAAASYIRGVAIGFPAMILHAVISPALQMDSDEKRVVIASNIDVTLNIILDILLAALGFGLFGIGLATSLGRYLNLFILLLHFRKRSHLLRFVPLKTSAGELLRILSMGTEKVFRRIGNVIRPVFVNKLILFYGGVTAITAMSVRATTAEVSDIFAVGLADTVGLLAGLYFGERNKDALRALGRAMHRNWLIFTGLTAVFLVLLSYPIAWLYIHEKGSVLSLTWLSLIALALQTLLQGLVRPRISYLQRIQRVKKMRALILVSSVIYPILSAFLLGALFGVYGVVFCYTVGDLLSLLTIWIFYAVTSRRSIPTPENYLSLPDDFEIRPGDVITLDIRDLEDVSVVSEQIGLFCKGHGLDKSLGNRAAVCFEEMAVNTINYGFPLNKTANPIIDLKVFISDGKLIIRMQDNCPMYDLSARLEKVAELSGEDRFSDLSTMVTWKLADDIRYVYSLKTNTIFMDFVNRRTALS